MVVLGDSAKNNDSIRLDDNFDSIQ